MAYRELPEEDIDISCLSRRDSLTSRYERVLRKWKNYCRQRDVDPLVADVKTVLDFVYGMYKCGCTYSGTCTARSALSSAVTIPAYERMSNLQMRGCQTILSYLNM